MTKEVTEGNENVPFFIYPDSLNGLMMFFKGLNDLLERNDYGQRNC